MIFSNENLRIERERVGRKKHLESLLLNLEKQRKELTKNASELESIMNNEQIDVDKLEKLSMTAILYTIIGKKDDKLSAEREEAYAAKMKYDVAAAELTDVKERITSINEELKALEGCVEKYQELLDEKKKIVKLSGGAGLDKILNFEEQILNAKNKRQEIKEALTEGAAAKSSAKDVLSSLSDAENWCNFDFISDGIIADIAKHNALDEAKVKVEKLHVNLRRFKTELTDIKIDSNINVEIDSFSKFADFFFDGFISNVSILNQIYDSQEKVKMVITKIDEVLNALKKMQKENQEEIKNLEWELGEVITNT